MKALFLLSLIFVLAACSKENEKYDEANSPLLGKWVEKNHRQDTLEVYRSGNKTLMFDNSLHFRMSGRMSRYDGFALHQVLLRTDSIGFKPFDAPNSHPFWYFYFRWINTDEFTMSYNGLRPYVSSIGTITCERVR